MSPLCRFDKYCDIKVAYEIHTLPKDVAKIVDHYQFIAYKQQSPKISILYCILDDFQN